MDIKKVLKKIQNWLPNFLLIILAVCISVFHFPEEIEMLAEDAFYQKPDTIPNQIKIIAIDEATLAELGPYSNWDRTYFAELIRILNENPGEKPKVIGIDVMFTGEGNSEGDRELVESVANAGNVILASKLETGSRVVLSDDNNRYYNQNYITDETTAFYELAQVSDAGFTNMILDEDGYIRRAYTYIETEEGIYKSFGFRVAERMVDEPERLYDNPSVVEFSYTGKPGDFEKIPMSMVLDGTVPASYFTDSIVLIGAYEEGMLDSYQIGRAHV